jgi:hypothetical protein
MAKIPTWDWHATCAEIERSARNKPRADRVRVLQPAVSFSDGSFFSDGTGFAQQKNQESGL